MAIFGNECPGRFFLMSGDEIIGDYASPVTVTETYLGEPFTAYVQTGTTGAGEPVYTANFYAPNGTLLNDIANCDIPNPFIITPPATEGGLWRVGWTAFRSWNGSTWISNPSGSLLRGKIYRYAYLIS